MLLRNLSEPEVGKVLFDSFKTAINSLTIQDSRHDAHRGSHSPARHPPIPNRPAPIPGRDEIRLQQDRRRTELGWVRAVVRRLSRRCDDVSAFAKNYFAVGFKLDYVKADGDLSNYTPDFIVKSDSGEVTIVKTEELDLPRRMARLAQWCGDASAASREQGGPAYR